VSTSNALVQLGNELTESTRLLEGQRRAVGTDNTPYETERRFGPTLVDAYVIDVKTGARRKFLERVMLVYEGENHGLRKKPNQVDYHYRILEWFGHYLKGEKARAWITEGTSYLDRQKELEALQKKAGGPSARPDGPRRGGPGRRRRPRAGS
jgi:hypothetical protein